MAEVLLTENDVSMQWLLHVLLGRAGYAVAHVPTLQHLVARTHHSRVPLVLILTGGIVRALWLAATGDALSTTDTTTAAGAGADDGVRTLLMPDKGGASRISHAAIVLTACPEMLPTGLLVALSRLAVPVLGKPCDYDRLLVVVAEAAGRLAHTPTYQGEQGATAHVAHVPDGGAEGPSYGAVREGTGARSTAARRT